MKTLAQWKELARRIRTVKCIRYARKEMGGLSENLLETGFQAVGDSQ